MDINHQALESDAFKLAYEVANLNPAFPVAPGKLAYIKELSDKILAFLAESVYC